jgi:integrase
VLRYVRHGREHWAGLGPLHAVGLKEARERAKAARLKLLDGVDLVAEKRQRKQQALIATAKAMTFAQAARQYFAQHQGKWRSAKHRYQYLSTLEHYAFPMIGNLSVAVIDKALVLKVLEQPIGTETFWQARPASAARVRGRIESVLSWAKGRGYRSGDNPAAWKDNLDKILPSPQRQIPRHFAAMSYAEMPGLMALLRAEMGTSARALEFLILTAARAGEVLGAQWSFDTATWTIPANRMKAGREHRVAILRPRVHQPSPLVEQIAALIGAHGLALQMR